MTRKPTVTSEVERLRHELQEMAIAWANDALRASHRIAALEARVTELEGRRPT